jgi:hypothetical protein
MTGNLDSGDSGNKENRDDDVAATTTSPESVSSVDGKQPREKLIYETPIQNTAGNKSIASKKEPTTNEIDFTWQEVNLKRSDFPVRLSLYDVDRNKVRICLGHTLLSTRFLQQQEKSLVAGNNVVSTHILHSTIASASLFSRDATEEQ